MKSTGIIRKIDILGRIVLPIELRRNLHINFRDSIDIFVNEKYIVLNKCQNKSSIGILREMDELGRVVLPKAIRDSYNLKHNDLVEIFMEGRQICLTKYHVKCVFCSETEDLIDFKDKKLCSRCIIEILK